MKRLGLVVAVALLAWVALVLQTSCTSPTDPQERYDGEWLGEIQINGTTVPIFLRIAYDNVDRVVIGDYEERILYPLGNEIQGNRFKVYLSETDVWLQGIFTSDREVEGTLHVYGAVYSWSAIKVRTKNGRLLVEESYFWEPHVEHLSGRAKGQLILEKVDLAKMVKHRYRLGFAEEGNRLVVYIGDLNRMAYLFRSVVFKDSMQFGFDGIRLTLINDPEYPFTPDDLYEFWFE